MMAALLQSITSEKGSSQPLLSNTGMQAAWKEGGGMRAKLTNGTQESEGRRSWKG